MWFRNRILVKTITQKHFTGRLCQIRNLILCKRSRPFPVNLSLPEWHEFSFCWQIGIREAATLFGARFNNYCFVTRGEWWFKTYRQYECESVDLLVCKARSRFIYSPKLAPVVLMYWTDIIRCCRRRAADLHNVGLPTSSQLHNCGFTSQPIRRPTGAGMFSVTPVNVSTSTHKGFPTGL